jgi:hypothetical protein
VCGPSNSEDVGSFSTAFMANCADRFYGQAAFLAKLNDIVNPERRPLRYVLSQADLAELNKEVSLRSQQRFPQVQLLIQG